jgi:hypothetical protein
MSKSSLNELCEQGQVQLMSTDYLGAARTFARTENIAWAQHDFDTLSRLYLPLQEARRQIRQRSGEGAMRMHLLARGPDDVPTADGITAGQVLIAGWGTIEPAIDLRIDTAFSLYLEVFLAAVYPTPDGNVVAILPTEDQKIPQPTPRSRAELESLLPFGSLLLNPGDLPADTDRGTAQSFAAVMALWERLHTPFLQAAEKETDPIKKMQAFRDTLKVDPACELAHQHLADVARTLARSYPRPLHPSSFA